MGIEIKMDVQTRGGGGGGRIREGRGDAVTRGVARRWSLTFNIHKKLLRPTNAKHGKCTKIFLLLAKKSDFNAKPKHCADVEE